MKTIIISSFHPLISRNILATKVLESLKERKIKIVLLVPENKKEYFIENFSESSVLIEPISVTQGKIDRLLYFFSLSLVGVDNHVIDDLRREGKRGRYLAAYLIRLIFGRVFVFHHIVRFIFRKLYSNNSKLTAIFKQYRPEIFFSTDIFSYNDAKFLLAARESGVYTVGMVRSWDNPTSKGVLLSLADEYVAPNPVICEELISLHHIPSDRISITGIPHHDSLNNTGGITKEAYFSALGLKPHVKTILYTVRGKIIFEHDDEFLKLFKQMLDDDLLGQPVQFLVFLPPADVADLSPIKSDTRFTVRALGQNITTRKKDTELSDSDNIELNNAIRYSDVMLTLGGTTMTIDGTILQRPVIALEFDPAPKLPDSVLKFKKTRCFKKLLDSGPVTVGHDFHDLVNKIKIFFNDPDINKKERTRTIERYAFCLDGHSSERLVQVLLKASHSQ